MGIVSDEDFEKELGNSNPKSIGKIVEKPPKGRGEGSVEVPDALRKVIGETSTTSGRGVATELASNFGISASSVSAYANGAKSTASYDDTPNKGIITGAKERIQKRARSKLLLALNHLTTDKLEPASAKELAGIARDMSAVVKNMEEPTIPTINNQNGPQFVFYAPQFRKEEHFDVVEAKE